ncbi:MAG: hypothetical protein LBT06_20960 [Hungatella sp.]|jgi:hypothetical protein|nr:hypothetical protein [Hungatella sp.]
MRERNLKAAGFIAVFLLMGAFPSFADMLKKPGEDMTQDRLWYTGDVQERTIVGVTYTFCCIDPDYMDAAKKRGPYFYVMK